LAIEGLSDETMDYTTNKTQSEQSEILDIEHWRAQLPKLQKAYQTDQPFPHIILNDFLNPKAAQSAMDAFPAVKDEGWIHYVHVNEKRLRQ